MSYSTPLRSSTGSDTTTYYHLVETRISYDITGKRTVESNATYLSESQQEQARLLAESASKIDIVSSPYIQQSVFHAKISPTTDSEAPLKRPSQFRSAVQQSPRKGVADDGSLKHAQPKASSKTFYNLFDGVFTTNKETKSTRPATSVEPLSEDWLIMDSLSTSSDVEELTCSEEDVGSIEEDIHVASPTISPITTSRSSPSSSPSLMSLSPRSSLSAPVDASDNHPLMPSFSANLSSASSTSIHFPQPQQISPSSTSHQPRMVADVSPDDTHPEQPKASQGFLSSIYYGIFGGNNKQQTTASAKPTQPLEDHGTELQTFTTNVNIASPRLSSIRGLGETVDATDNHPLMPSEPQQIVQSPRSPRQMTSSVNPNPVVIPSTASSVIPSNDEIGADLLQTPVIPLTQPVNPSAPTDVVNPTLIPKLQPRLPNPQALKLPLPEQLPPEDFSTEPQVQPRRPNLPKLPPLIPSEPLDQILPVPQGNSAAISDNSSSSAQLVSTEKPLAEPKALVLDSSLNAEQIERITAYTLQPLVPELSDEDLEQLTPQKLMTRALNARQEPAVLREAIVDLQSALEELSELKEAIAATQKEAQAQTLTIDLIRKNAENIAISKARMLLVLNRIYPGRDSQELKTIAENECVALAQKYIAQAQERLQELATRVPVPVKPKAVVQDPVALKLANLRKQLKLTTGSIGTANGALGRAKRATPLLEKKVKKLHEELNAITANGEHDKLEAALSKLSDEEKLLDEKMKEVPAQEKKIETLQAKKAKLEQEIAELEASQSSSAETNTNI